MLIIHLVRGSCVTSIQSNSRQLRPSPVLAKYILQTPTPEKSDLNDRLGGSSPFIDRIDRRRGARREIYSFLYHIASPVVKQCDRKSVQR